jgi:hypothetical protein
MEKLYDEDQLIPLLPLQNKKPLDVGCGLLSASIGVNGLVRTINSYHPKHGFITLAPFEQFPNDKWNDSDFVRQYRRLLDSDKVSGFGMKPKEKIVKQDTYLYKNKFPFYCFELENAKVTSIFLSVEYDGTPFLINQIQIYNKSEKSISIPLEVGGTFSLNRCSYGQLTEGGPIFVPSLENDFEVQNNHIMLSNSNLPAEVNLAVFDEGKPLSLAPAKHSTNVPVEYKNVVDIELGQDEFRTLNMVYQFDIYESRYQRLDNTSIQKLINHSINSTPAWQKSKFDNDDFIIQRNLDYIKSCCSIPVSEEHICVITDHQLLPLAWNRDAYYMLELLFEIDKKQGELSGSITQKNEIQEIIRKHLLWTFERADRPNGYWGRAYLTTGFCKDHVFQMDQQCYPLIELCDYYEQYQDKETVNRLLLDVKEIINIILKYKDEQKWLFKTEETPADDAVEYPYHFSTQILIWYTFKKLHKLNEKFSFIESDLSEWAEQTRKDCLLSFEKNYKGKDLFSYLTDLNGNYKVYYDCADLPTVLAPIWGFCDVNDEKWINTLEFAFTTENIGGFYPGKYGGLGSVHTPHSWPMGDLQEIIYSDLIGDIDRRDKALKKIKDFGLWDGLISEAINEESGEIVSRHWFSWPGASLSVFLLNLKRESESN